jgi:hypothetical protein
MKREPAIATGLLKLFCSDAHYDAATGDLMEQYQAGRGTIWYWRQVLDILCLALFSKVLRRPLVRTQRMPVGQALGLFLLFCALSASFVSLAGEILMIIIGIVMTGVFIFLYLSEGTNRAPFDRPPLPISTGPSVHPGISLHHIPVEGAVGLLFVIGTALIFAIGIRQVREILLLTVPLGIFGGGLLLYWHKNHPIKLQGLGLIKRK